MLNFELINKEYDFMQDVIFLNVASVVMPPNRVQKDYNSFMSRYIANFGEDVVGRAWQIVANTRPKISRLLNCQPEEIAFVKNTAEGIGTLAMGYPFKPGDNVVIADQEHSSNLYAWINVQRRGVQLKIVPSTNNCDINLDNILANLDEHTKILAISAVQFSTGFYADLERLGAECKKRGIIFVVDAIQAYGRLNIDVQKCNISWLACGGNKGALATLGVGFIYCKNELAPKISPSFAGYQSTITHASPPSITENFETLEFCPHARRFEAGNLNYAGIEALGNGADLLFELGLENIQEHILKLEKLLRAQLQTLKLHIVTPAKESNYGGVICIYYPKEAETQVVEILKKHKIYATMRGGYIRFGINFYNTKEQMQRVGQAMWEIQDSI